MTGMKGKGSWEIGRVRTQGGLANQGQSQEGDLREGYSALSEAGAGLGKDGDQGNPRMAGQKDISTGPFAVVPTVTAYSAGFCSKHLLLTVTFKDDPKQYRLSASFTWELNLQEVTGLAQSQPRRKWGSWDLDPAHLATTCYELFVSA